MDFKIVMLTKVDHLNETTNIGTKFMIVILNIKSDDLLIDLYFKRFIINL